MKIKKTFQGSLPENRILNTHSSSQTDTYSCDYINDSSVVVSATEPTGNNRKKIWMQKGKNLLRIDDSGTQIGVTKTTKTSEMILNGTTDSVANIFSNVYLCTLEKGNYTFKVYSDDSLVTMQNDADCAFILRNLTSNTNISEKSLKWSDKTIKFTLTEESKIGLTMYANSTNIVFNNYNMKLMIQQGTEIGEYEENIEQKIYIKNNNDVYEEFKKDVKYEYVKANDFIQLNTGFSIWYNRILKHGNHYFGYIGLEKTSNFTGADEIIGTLKVQPKYSEDFYGVTYSNEYAIPSGFATGSIATTSSQFKVKGSTAGRYLKFYIDFVTN